MLIWVVGGLKSLKRILKQNVRSKTWLNNSIIVVMKQIRVMILFSVYPVMNKRLFFFEVSPGFIVVVKPSFLLG